MLLILLSLFILWIYVLECKKYCPKCGTRLDRAGNEYHCRKCRILWHMNAFGKLKRRK